MVDGFSFEIYESVPHYDISADDLCGFVPISSGSSSYVLRAGADGQFAIKAFVANEARARAEYDTLRHLSESDCPGVPMAYCFGRVTDGSGKTSPAIVMQRIEGTRLADIQKLHGASSRGLQPMGPGRAAAIAAALAELLKGLARAGVVHGDISPRNIILAGRLSTEVYLVDFGSSRVFDPENPMALDGDDILATIRYGAPEVFGGVFHERKRADKTDVWSLGALLAGMVSGERWPDGVVDLRTAATLTAEDMERVSVAKRLPIDLCARLRMVGIEPGRGEMALANVVSACTNYIPALRPSPSEVEVELSNIMNLEYGIDVVPLDAAECHPKASLTLPDPKSGVASLLTCGESDWLRFDDGRDWHNRRAYPDEPDPKDEPWGLSGVPCDPEATPLPWAGRFEPGDTPIFGDTAIVGAVNTSHEATVVAEGRREGIGSLTPRFEVLEAASPDFDGIDLGKPLPYGSGGFASVWRAGINGEYVIKSFYDADEHEAREEYERLATLNSAGCRHVPEVICYGTFVDQYDQFHHAFVERFVDSMSLAQVLDCGLLAVSARAHTVPTGQAVAVALELARGLSEIAESGIAHRGLSPSDIILTKECLKEGFCGDVGLFLVGFSQSTETGRRTVTLDTPRLAPICYGAPEVFGGDYYANRNSEKADIWSLGALICTMVACEYWPSEILYLRTTFQISQNDLTRIAEAKRNPIDLIALMEAAGVTVGPAEQGLADLVRTCTDYNPHYRPSIEAAIGALEHIAHSMDPLSQESGSSVPFIGR